MSEGESREWSPQLAPRPGLGLELVDEDGEPLRQWAVDFSVRDGLWNLSAVTDARGVLRAWRSTGRRRAPAFAGNCTTPGDFRSAMGGSSFAGRALPIRE
jgi:hypothetical protein